jgi:hypothetical protein
MVMNWNPSLKEISLEGLPFATGGFMKGFPEESFPESKTAGGINGYSIMAGG